MKQVTFILTIVLLYSSIATAEVYKWRDESGKLHFSDTPPVTNEQVEQITIKDNITTGNYIPAAKEAITEDKKESDLDRRIRENKDKREKAESDAENFARANSESAYLQRECKIAKEKVAAIKTLMKGDRTNQTLYYAQLITAESRVKVTCNPDE